MITRNQKAIIRTHIISKYADRGARDVRIHADESVTAHVSPMPNTNKAGRIFCGWAQDLLRAAEK
jgi:hypothetical protein